jgi:hypothetical protein
MSFFRDSEVGQQKTDGRFKTAIQTVGDLSDVDLEQLQTDLDNQLDRFTNLGSGWSLSRIIRFTLHVAAYRPLAGKSYIETPESIANKKAVVNVKNKDEKCFQWAILSALFPSTENVNDVSKYVPFVKEVNWSGLRFPVTVNQVRLFERNNQNFTVNVYVYEESEDDVIPIYVTKCGMRAKHIDLLLLKDGEKCHYVWIKRMSALVCHRTKSKAKVYVCPHCIHPFTIKESFENHLSDCAKHKRQKISFPEENRDKLFWKSYSKTEFCPFVIYADFESYLSPVESSTESSTRVVNEHIPSGFCAYTVSRDKAYRTEPFLYSGPDCMDQFFDHLLREQRRISFILGEDYDMLPLTREEQAEFDASTVCDSCNKPYTEDNRKVRHHSHRTGEFISACLAFYNE